MKIHVLLKDPDTMHDAVEDAFRRVPCPALLTADEWAKVRAERVAAVQGDISSRWMDYGEYLEVEFDTDAHTAIVIPTKGSR